MADVKLPHISQTNINSQQ